MFSIRGMDRGEIVLRAVAIIVGLFFMFVSIYAPFVLYFGEPGAEALIFACVIGGPLLYIGIKK